MLVVALQGPADGRASPEFVIIVSLGRIADILGVVGQILELFEYF